MANIFDRLGNALEDVKDTFVEQAPLILPIALNILAPGMGTIAASTLGAGIGSLIRGDDLNVAVRNAAMAGATGAAYKGFTGGGLEGIRQDIGQTGQFFQDPLSSKQYAPSVGGSFGVSEQPITDKIADEPFERVPLEDPSFLKGPFQSTPSGTDIVNSTQYKELFAQTQAANPQLGPDAVNKLVIDDLKAKFSPSFVDKFALPGVLGLAALMDNSGEEMDEEEMPLTGAELLEMYPEEYGINLPYLDRPLFSAKNGGVARMQNGGGEAVPNKYKGFSKLPEAVQQKISPELAQKYDDGGVAQYFPRRNGGIGPGEGSGTKDDVPAMLMDGEFVMTRDAVKGIGDGNLNKGIDRMYTMMDRFERMA